MPNEIRADMLKVKKMISEVEMIIGKREDETKLVNKLIDAENLLTYCMSRLENAVVPPDAHYPEWYARDIREIPAADVVEVKHGYWIKGGEEKLYFAYDMSGIYDFPLVCSNCKTDVTEYDYEETPFCPFCGAKMDGDKNDLL